MFQPEHNAACLAVATEAEANPAWADYATYCRLREQGLRKQAFDHLKLFMTQAKSWEFESQKEFVLWLCGKMGVIKDADYGPYPTPLQSDFFLPFFEEWLRREPKNDKALALKGRWLGDLTSYQEAIKVNTHNQLARYALASQCIYDILHATHHLPEYFIGDEQQVKERAEAARDHISHLEQTNQKQFLSKELAEAECLLDDWIAFEKEGAQDFDSWCKRHGRSYSWVEAYYFDAKP
jgi:hypothetical protein